MILGIDEAGRGPWAGPLAVGAVVLGGVEIDGLTDSKRLSKKRREELSSQILEVAAAAKVGWASSEEIDALGLSESLTLATKRAVEAVGVPYHEIIIDGTVNFLKDTKKGEYVATMKKADLLVPSVSAASIIAKVARDRFMARQDDIYPGYGFGRHAGYGTAAHRLAIEKLGVTPLHRLSFAPLKAYRPPVEHSSEDNKKPAPTFTGLKAEAVVCEHLESKGHVVLDRNWRTKFCEIDIISTHNDTVYFTEVKYRKKPDHGDGIAAITPKKLRQMKFAAEYYILSKKLTRTDRLLAVASVSGQPPVVNEFLVLK